MNHPLDLKIVAAALVAAALGAAPARAQEKIDQEKDFSKGLDTILDENSPLDARTRAITYCGNMTNSKNEKFAAKKDQYRKTLDTLLRGLGGKQPRSEEQEKVAAVGFEGVGKFFVGKGFPELAKISKPFLSKPAKNETRGKVLFAMERAGAPGAGVDLVTIFSPSYFKDAGGDEADRDRLEMGATRAARSLPGNEALDVLVAAIKNSTSFATRKFALSEVGDFVLMRKPREYDRGRIVNLLQEVSKSQSIALEVGDAAAVTLLRHNSFDGMPAVMDRLAGKVPQKTTYAAVCVAAHKPDGFAGVTPRAFDETVGAPRDEAIAAAQAWWQAAQKGSPEAVVMEVLKAEGVSVPKDTASKDYVGALIDGLQVRNYPLRNAVLDLLVPKIARPDFAATFRSLSDESVGDTVTIRFTQKVDESVENDPKQLDKLMTQQEAKARKLREAWDKVKDKATYESGVWNAPWEPEKPARRGSSGK